MVFLAKISSVNPNGAAIGMVLGIDGWNVGAA